jgi:uncharacterized RDD family membrane protein YckC
MKILDIVRGLVRPFIAIATWLALLIIAVLLIIKFADISMADKVLTFVLATGATIAGFYFGERSQKPKTKE